MGIFKDLLISRRAKKGGILIANSDATQPKHHRLLNEIQSLITANSVPLSEILLKVRVLSQLLGDETIKEWASSELNGYKQSNPLPDYRVIEMQPLGNFTNGFWHIRSQPVPLFAAPKNLQEKMERVSLTRGIRIIEDLGLRKDPAYFPWDPVYVVYFNNNVPLSNDLVLEHAWHQLDPAYFNEILSTVRSRLLDFVLELSNFTWEPTTVDTKEIRGIFQLTIYNNRSYSMTTFDQSNQQVQQQNNAGVSNNITGGINLGDMQNQLDFLGGLRSFRTDIDLAAKEGRITQDQADDINFNVAQALQEAKADSPNRSSILEKLDDAKGILVPIASAHHLLSIVDNLRKLAERWGS